MNGMATETIHGRGIGMRSGSMGPFAGGVVMAHQTTIRAGATCWFGDLLRISAALNVSCGSFVTGFADCVVHHAVGDGALLCSERMKRPSHTVAAPAASAAGGVSCAMAAYHPGIAARPTTRASRRIVVVRIAMASPFRRARRVVRPSSAPSVYRAWTLSTDHSELLPWHAAQASAGSVAPGKVVVFR